jgi:hypothetical protein
MLSWLFGKKDQATRGEDSVWLSDAARLKGILREVERLAQGHSVVVVAWTLPTFDDLARQLDQHKPLLCRDLFGFDALRGQLARSESVAVALANVLSSDVKPSLTGVPVEILVCGRNERRATDDTIVRFADLIGSNTRVAFHLSLDDALLKDYIGTLSQLLTRLAVSPDEAISHPMVTRAIAQAQVKKKS